mgnify:FL=1
MGINIKSEASAASGDIMVSQNFTEYVKKTELGLVFGTEVNIQRFNVGVRYGIGTEIADHGSDRNSVVSFVAGVRM